MGIESDEKIGEDCEEIVKEKNRNPSLTGLVNTKIWPEGPRKLEDTLQEVKQRGGATPMRR